MLTALSLLFCLWQIPYFLVSSCPTPFTDTICPCHPLDGLRLAQFHFIYLLRRRQWQIALASIPRRSGQVAVAHLPQLWWAGASSVRVFLWGGNNAQCVIDPPPSHLFYPQSLDCDPSTRLLDLSQQQDELLFFILDLFPAGNTVWFHTDRPTSTPQSSPRVNDSSAHHPSSFFQLLAHCGNHTLC